MTGRAPRPPEPDRPAWTCPGCETTFDGRPEIVTGDPFECYCSEECYVDAHDGSSPASEDGESR